MSQRNILLLALNPSSAACVGQVLSCKLLETPWSGTTDFLEKPNSKMVSALKSLCQGEGLDKEAHCQTHLSFSGVKGSFIQTVDFQCMCLSKVFVWKGA